METTDNAEKSAVTTDEKSHPRFNEVNGPSDLSRSQVLLSSRRLSQDQTTRNLQVLNIGNAGSGSQASVAHPRTPNHTKTNTTNLAIVTL